VRAKRAELENARIDLKESRRYLGAIEKAKSVFPDVAYHKARTADEADQLSLGQPAEVRSSQPKISCGKGRVVFVGRTADKRTGLVSVVVHLTT
jgi:hypothetical protein